MAFPNLFADIVKNYQVVITFFIVHQHSTAVQSVILMWDFFLSICLKLLQIIPISKVCVIFPIFIMDEDGHMKLIRVDHSSMSYEINTPLKEHSSAD